MELPYNEGNNTLTIHHMLTNLKPRSKSFELLAYGNTMESTNIKGYPH